MTSLHLGSKKYLLLIILPLIAAVFDYSNLLNGKNNMQINSEYKETLVQFRVQTDNGTRSLCIGLC
jgi:hypothetical protein